MHMQMYIIKFKLFGNEDGINQDSLIAIFFGTLFMFISFFEKNLFLSNGLGLLEHINIWIFLILNILIPIAINKSIVVLNNVIDKNIFKKLVDTFNHNANLKNMVVLSRFVMVVGFCFFIGNSLQNANIINKLPFDYWDSINYKISYIVSRFYKLYLFAYFIPVVLIYVYTLIRSISNLLTISKSEMKKYPIEKYTQLNILCNFGLNILIIILLSFVFMLGGISFVHNRFDITTIATFITAILVTLIYLRMYALLIRKFCADITKYKKKQLAQLDGALAEIHQRIIHHQFNSKDGENLESALRKEEYLQKTRERIEQLSKYPLIIKAISTSISPIILALLKIIFSS